MRLSQKINIVLFVVFALFLGIGAFTNYQYGRLQSHKRWQEIIKYNVDSSAIDSSEIVGNMLIGQDEAIDLYLKKIRQRDGLEDVVVISRDDGLAAIGKGVCQKLDAQGSQCLSRDGRKGTLYSKMSYGNGEFGYIRKVFAVPYGGFMSASEIVKFALLLSILYLVVFVALSKSIRHIIIDPLRDICNRIRPMSRGEYDINIPEQKTDELKNLADDIAILSCDIKHYQMETTRHANLVSLGQSTAMVAHDVRKPLTSMKALLCALPEIKDNPAELKKVVTTVDRNISQTNAMLNDVLEFSRDATALDLKDNNSSGLITSALGDALRNHPGSDVRIEYDLKHQYALRSDVTRITRVLTNIIDNALDAMASPQTGKVTGTLHFETYDTEREGKKFGGIVIRDSGPGIPEEALARIFDPFFTKGKKGGTGLGLAICHRVISLHEGKIEAMNQDGGGGAKFVIELPLGKDRVGPRESEFIRDSSELETFRKEEALRVDYGDTANTTEFLKINKERNRKSYLLIVDDEPLFRESVRATLNELTQVRDHVTFIEVDSAENAMPVLEAREFDYVIADIDLGSLNMNGYDFAQMVLKRYPNTHVLIHSNKRKMELDRNVREIMSDKFMGFLPKPMRPEELLQFLACKTFEVDETKVAAVSNKKKILVLNDDDALLVSFKILLRAPNVQVLPASNVSDALKHLTDQKVDIILSDINLGNNEPDGYDFLKKVRESHKDVPFYMVSGMSSADEEPKAKNLGATGYLQLPIETEMLKKLVQ